MACSTKNFYWWINVKIIVSLEVEKNLSFFLFFILLRNGNIYQSDEMKVFSSDHFKFISLTKKKKIELMFCELNPDWKKTRYQENTFLIYGVSQSRIGLWRWEFP